MNTLRVNVGVATEKLLENFDDEFASFSSERGTAGRGKAHRGTDVLLYSDEESSLGDSSLNQVRIPVCHVLGVRPIDEESSLGAAPSSRCASRFVTFLGYVQ